MRTPCQHLKTPEFSAVQLIQHCSKEKKCLSLLSVRGGFGHGRAAPSGIAAVGARVEDRRHVARSRSTEGDPVAAPLASTSTGRILASSSFLGTSSFSEASPVFLAAAKDSSPRSRRCLKSRSETRRGSCPTSRARGSAATVGSVLAARYGQNHAFHDFHSVQNMETCGWRLTTRSATNTIPSLLTKKKTCPPRLGCLAPTLSHP